MSARTMRMAALLIAGGLSLTPEAVAAQTTRRVLDPPTDASIKITRRLPGTATVEVIDGRIHIRKDVLVGRSITTITSGHDRISLTIDRAGIVVMTPSGTAATRLKEPESINAVTEMLAQSAAGTDGRLLLARLRLDPGSVEGQALSMTRALLESVATGQADPVAVSRWTNFGAHGARPVPVGLGPTAADCWNSYVSSATQTANTYVNCYYSVPWYDVPDRLGCAALYDIEAEGDWLWYLNCVGAPLPMFGAS